jgi:ATP-dependent helicase HrpB
MPAGRAWCRVDGGAGSGQLAEIMPYPPLPIDPALPDLLAALERAGCAVLQAPPGAGKTTRVPLALLEGAPWLGSGSILVLEPRRLAARAAARRMAAMLGEDVGRTVGYRVRMDARVSAATRIEVVTEGLYLRRLQEDPELSGVGAVLFDEIHERGIDGDLALALTLETKSALRPDLRLLPMSATLDAGPVARLLGDAPVITSEGRAYPVEVRHLESPPAGTRIEDAAARAVRRALAEDEGSLLVFLPGGGEIRRVQERLGDLPPTVTVAPLYGDLPGEAQDRAIEPARPGTRKIVLATPIAETSLTIEGVRVVIDSGLVRAPRFDPGSGMTRLVTQKVSQASSEQRRGRAGRLEPGVCYRLWPEPEQRALAPFAPPEILDADLTPLALELAVWGAGADTLAWLDPPPAVHLEQARGLLRDLGALDGAGRITGHGRRMAGFGVHPRLAHMMLRGKELGFGGLACRVAAILGERDILKGVRDIDLTLRLDALAGDRAPGLDRGAAQQALKQAKVWARQLGVGVEEGDTADTGLAVALAYPDRIAQRRPGGPASYRLSGGRGAAVAETDRLATAPWLAVADLDGAAREARVFLAAPVSQTALEEVFESDIRHETVVAWDEREQAVLARRRRMLFALALEDKPWSGAPADAVLAAMLDGVRALGIGALPWSEGALRWRERVAFLRRVEGEEWPDLTDVALTETLDDWLTPWLTGVSRRAHLERVDLFAALEALLPWPMRQRLEAEAPTHVTVPSGSRVPIDYSGETPVLAVRLQEMFGLAETPRVAGGRMPLLLHLLSPARRPVQVTRDLAGFWAGAYREVKADLKGRYPKHHWPDNPLEAEPTARAKPRK